MAVKCLAAVGGAAAILVGLASPTSAAATVTVNTTADLAPAVNECNGVPGDCSIRRALDKAASTDTIVVPAQSAHYSVSAGELVINKNITIQGAGARKTIIDAQEMSRVFDIVSPASTDTFTNVTITGGSVTGVGPLFGGAGIYDNAGTLTVTGSILSNNHVTATAMGCCNGGGAIWSASSLTVTGSRLVGNSFTVSGVGGDCCNGGGAIYFNGGDQTLTGDTFSQNTATIRDVTSSACCVGGGAYFNDGGQLTIDQSTFNDDALSISGAPTLSGGGAVFHDGGGFSLTNSTLTRNKAAPLGGGANTGGGAIFYDGGTATVTNATIARNSTDGAGGGILAEPTVTAKDAIISGGSAASGANCASAATGAFASAGYNLESADTCGFHGTGDRANTSPGLKPLANNGGPTQTMALPLSSPAVDRGASSGLTVDQRGRSRPFDFPGVPAALGGDSSDIGAFELHPVDIPNAFSFGKLKRHKKPGTATLIVILPGAGTISLTGKRVVGHQTPHATVAHLPLEIVPTGKAKTQLKKTGRAKVKIRVTFTPTGGLARTRTKTIHLVERK